MTHRETRRPGRSSDRSENWTELAEAALWLLSAGVLIAIGGPTWAFLGGLMVCFPLAMFLVFGALPLSLARQRRRMEERERLLLEDPEVGRSDQWRDTRWIRNTMLMGLGSGMVAETLYAFSQGGWSSTTGFIGAVVLLVGGAAFLSGALAGFLFGIPRTLQGAGQVPPDVGADAAKVRPDVDSSRYAVNTNLEQISDWLTKIIVGIGLVELRQVPDLVSRLGYFLQESAGSLSGLPGPVLFSQTVLISTVVYFLVNGFFCGYLLTRVYLAGAFSRADRLMNERATWFHRATKILGRAQNDRPIGQFVDLEEAGELDRTTTAFIGRLVRWVEDNGLRPRDLDPADAELVGDAYYRQDRYADALAFYDGALAEAPRNGTLALKAALAEGESGKRERAIARLKELSGTPSAPIVVNKLLGYFLLWFPSRLRESISRSEEYLRLAPEDSGAIFNVACANAQLYGLSRDPVDRDEALKKLKAAIEKDAQWKDRARELLGDDFSSLSEDPEFLKMIGLP